MFANKEKKKADLHDEMFDLVQPAEKEDNSVMTKKSFWSAGMGKVVKKAEQPRLSQLSSLERMT